MLKNSLLLRRLRKTSLLLLIGLTSLVLLFSCGKNENNSHEVSVPETSEIKSKDSVDLKVQQDPPTQTFLARTEEPKVLSDNNRDQELKKNNFNSSAQKKSVPPKSIPEIQANPVPKVSMRKMTRQIANASEQSATLEATASIEKSTPLTVQPTLAEKEIETKITPEILNDFINVWLGLGVNYFNYIQRSTIDTETGQFSDQTLSTLSVGTRVYIDEKSKIDFQYDQVTGKIKTQGETTLSQTELIRKSMDINLQYAAYQKENETYSVLFGIKENHLPLLSTDYNRNIVSLLENQLIMASVGMNYIRQTKSSNQYEASFKYQKLLSARSLDGYELQLSPRLLIEGSIGVSRRLKSNFNIGLYWSLQSLDFGYQLRRSGLTSSGDEKIIDSSLQLRFGWYAF